MLSYIKSFFDEKEEIETSIFGTCDGLMSALGVVIAEGATATHHALLVAALALAVGSAASMGAGQWLSDNDKSYKQAFIMGIATLFGSISPAIPFFFTSGLIAWILCGIITIIVASIVAELRPGGRLWSYVVTFGVLIVASALGVGASFLGSI